PLRPFESPAPLSTDTRTIAPGDFYLPLTGANFDGQKFVSQAIDQGAVGAFLSAGYFEEHRDALTTLPNLIVVPDTLVAYMQLGRAHLLRHNPTVIGITGSSGKTTTKEMIDAALSGVIPTQKSEKNHNNEIGVTQTLLNLEPETKVLIVEMGMRGLNQINVLSKAATPQIGVITNIGPAHIGLLGSLENIAKAKCELFEGMDPQRSIGILNADDALLMETAQGVWQGRVEAYSLNEVSHIQSTPEGGIRFSYQDQAFTLSVPGQYNISNALAAIKIGETLGVELSDMAEGLAHYQPIEGRWRREPLPGYENSCLINDAYNANPDSIKASLKGFLEADLPTAKRVLIIGGMKELGAFSEQYHRDLGNWLATQSGIDLLITAGEEAQLIAEAATDVDFPVLSTSGLDTADEHAVLESIERAFCEFPLDLNDTTLLLKGSRSCRLEIFVSLLLQYASKQTPLPS
nr:UDP-N-acetylmuramoyl-tripeptide--D-alanyl-D-alanine ligase [Vampirovibrio sp.]